MKRFFAKLAAAVNRMKTSIDHMFDAYAEAIDSLKDTPAYMPLFETYEMM